MHRAAEASIRGRGNTHKHLPHHVGPSQPTCDSIPGPVPVAITTVVDRLLLVDVNLLWGWLIHVLLLLIHRLLLMLHNLHLLNRRRWRC